MSSYTPFDTPLSRLVAEDLEALRSAQEGWYIEYKRETPVAKKLAKSIAAFANTYGGWLFLGVQELSKVEAVAGSFPGLSAAEADVAQQRLRKCAADYLNPVPYFEVGVVHLHAASGASLEPCRAVVCINISQSSAAPHVHKDGVIYRRVSDGSEPRPENDRFIIDQISQRKNFLLKKHEEWDKNDPEFSVGEEKSPYIRLMLLPDPWLERDLDIGTDVGQIRSILGGAPGSTCRIPFDTVHTRADGFVGRQLKRNDPADLGLTWILRRNLASDIFIPLHTYSIEREPLHGRLFEYKFSEAFFEILSKYKVSFLKIVDLNFVFSLTLGVLEILEGLREISGFDENFYFRIKLMNCWRTVPFLDVKAAIENMAAFGLPMCLESRVAMPYYSGPDGYYELKKMTNLNGPEAQKYLDGLRIFVPVAQAFGVSEWIMSESDDSFFNELMDASERALQIQNEFDNADV